MDYSYAFEKRDFGRIDKLNSLHDLDTYYKDVRKFTKNVMSDHAIHRWEHLSELRWMELKGEKDPRWLEAIHDPALQSELFQEEAKAI